MLDIFSASFDGLPDSWTAKISSFFSKQYLSKQKLLRSDRPHMLMEHRLADMDDSDGEGVFCPDFCNSESQTIIIVEYVELILNYFELFTNFRSGGVVPFTMYTYGVSY